MSIKKYDVDGDPTPDDTAGGTDSETDRPASSNVVFDINTAVALNTAKVTNATHTGDVTGATELTIAAGAVDIAMLADGTDGQLITWDADGKPAVVATGTATHVLTSNGAGAAPTFQAAAGGGDISTDDNWVAKGDLVKGTGENTADILSIGTDNYYLKVATDTAAWEALDISDDTSPTLGGDTDCNNKDLANIALAEFYAETANTSASSAVTIAWTASNKQNLTLEASTATTVTFTAPGGPCNLLLRIIQHASGAGTITWPATVMWPDATAPTLTATGAAVDICTFYWDGTNYHGCANLAFGVPA